MLNYDPQLWPHPTLDGHDFYNCKSTLSEDASWVIGFWEEDF